MIHILVISAQADLQSFLSGNQTGLNGIKVDYCQSLQSAMQRISENSGYQIIFADADYMAIQNSFYLNQLIVQNPVSKVILLFDEPEMDRIRKFMNLGIYDFLVRPIAADDLRATLHKVLRELLMLSDVLTQHDRLVNIEQELEVARKIQQSLLRNDYPYFTDNAGIDAIGQLISSREVGGDFFDCFLIDKNRIGLVIGDVAGKGLPAALEMARIKTTLQAIAVEGDSVAECLSELNKSMFTEQNPEIPVALFYGIINILTGHLSYCNAGIPGSYHLRDLEEPRYFNGKMSHPLGMSRHTIYQEQQLMLAPGESIFIFSDGLVDAFGSGLEKKLHTLMEHPELKTGFSVKTAANKIMNYAKRSQPHDDLTGLFLHYRGLDGSVKS